MHLFFLAPFTEGVNSGFPKVDFGNASLPCFSSFTVPVKPNFSTNPNHKYGHLKTSGLLEICIQISVLHMSRDRSLGLNALQYYGSACGSTVSLAGASLHWEGDY